METFSTESKECLKELDKMLIAYRKGKNKGVVKDSIESKMDEAASNLKNLKKNIRRWKENKEEKKKDPQEHKERQKKFQSKYEKYEKRLEQFKISFKSAVEQGLRKELIGSDDSDSDASSKSDSDSDSEDEHKHKRPIQQQEIELKEKKFKKNQKEFDNDVVVEQLFKDVYKVQDENIEIAMRIAGQAEKAQELGANIVEEIGAQNEQLRAISKQMDQLGGTIKRARQEVTSFMRGIATDKVILVVCCLFSCVILLGVILVVGCKAGLCNLICTTIPNIEDTCEKIPGML